MANEQSELPCEPADHLLEGRHAADQLALIGRDFVWAASLGRNDRGESQVLILGGQTVKLSPTDCGTVTEMHRTHIRSVEVVPGQGLLLRAPGHRWLHRLADADAAYLRDRFIESPIIPPLGSGGIAIPEQDWRHDQIAHLVGLIVMRAAEAEHLLSLVAAYGREPGSFDHEAFGRSGQQLLERLENIAVSSAAITDMAERYDAWSEHRNQLVHSIRPTENGLPGPTTSLPIIKKKNAAPPKDLYNVQTQDVPELVDLWYAFNWLYHDAWHAYLDLSTGVEAKDLPLPNSVSGSRRLPADFKREQV